MPTYQDTNTAADLIRYEKYTDSVDGVEKLSRSNNGLQEWLVKATDGQTFYIKFDKNFSKKHLVTESKKTTAQRKTLNAKMGALLDHRSKTEICSCAHNIKKHQSGKKKNPVPCKECVANSQRGARVCQNYGTPYADDRQKANKPDTNPLAGTATKINTCIILNRVPKQDFENAVLKSILAWERPPLTWKKGDPLAMKDRDQVVLKWEFGARNPNAVVQADLSKPANQWPTYEGCKVEAIKLANQQDPTWQVFHMKDVI